MTKAKAKIQPAAQPDPAAPAVVTLAPNGNAIVNPAPTEETAPATAQADESKNADAQVPVLDAPKDESEQKDETKHPQQDKIDQCRQALRSFPTLPEGYICGKGIYFVKELAEKMLEEGEELIIVTPEMK